MIWDYECQIHAPDGRCRWKIGLRIVAYFSVLLNIYALMQFFEIYIYMHIAYGPMHFTNRQEQFFYDFELAWHDFPSPSFSPSFFHLLQYYVTYVFSYLQSNESFIFFYWKSTAENYITSIAKMCRRKSRTQCDCTSHN